MNPNHKKKTLSYYSKLFKKFGYNPKSLGWGNKKGKQSIQFETLFEIGELTNNSILDVGCGFADMYAYLKFRKKNVKYFGVDINPDFIAIAKKLYPEINLEVRDIQEKKITRKFDWVFFSGISSAGCNYSYIQDILKEMFRVCKKGVAMNFVGGKLDFKSKGLFYSEPGEIYSIAQKLSNRIVLRHDYAPYQFVLYVYKNNTKTSNQIFKEYLDKSKIKFDDTKWHPFFKKTIKMDF